jgi:hypothetical protein
MVAAVVSGGGVLLGSGSWCVVVVTTGFHLSMVLAPDLGGVDRQWQARWLDLRQRKHLSGHGIQQHNGLVQGSESTALLPSF